MLKEERKELQRCTPVTKPIEWPVDVPFDRRPTPIIPISSEDLDELQARKEPFVKQVSPLTLRPTLVQEIKNKYYKNISIAVGGVAFTNRAVGLRDLDIVADEITIISYPVGSLGISYILNDPTNDTTPVVAPGQKEDQFEIEEIYLNDDGTGPAGNIIIRVVWNPYLIRLAP